MGGPGSGRRKSLKRRLTTEDIPSILVGDLVGKNAPEKGVPVVRVLRAPKGQVELESVRVRDSTYSVIVRAPSERGGAAATYTLRVLPTLCHYGGSRPWLECPQRGCGKFATRLYFHGLVMLCRECAGLSYPSQTRGPTERRLARIQAIRQKLNAPSGPRLKKPARMHEKTYLRLMRELRALEQEAAATIDERVPRDAPRPGAGTSILTHAIRAAKALSEREATSAAFASELRGAAVRAAARKEPPGTS